MAKRVLIAGLGNPMMGDDGFGAEVVRQLIARVTAGAGIDVIECRAADVDLAERVAAYDAVILIDAMDLGLETGAVRLFSESDIAPLVESTGASAHSMPIPQWIALARKLGAKNAQFWLVAAQAEQFEMGRGLSAPLAVAVEGSATLVLGLLSRCLE